MGDIDRIVPATPAVQPPSVARRAGDRRRDARRDARDDVLELENVEDEPEALVLESDDPDDPHTLDLAV
ncbi:MAG: hypothetical protein M9921_15495 [Fimbriimonadaceae bacterium]|nr:hypothetical protein [Chthonomonadaceae bacterium]MCO5298252.1 hypothetical protein [Fimbriimonadaceae bacterium]